MVRILSPVDTIRTIRQLPLAGFWRCVYNVLVDTIGKNHPLPWVVFSDFFKVSPKDWKLVDTIGKNHPLPWVVFSDLFKASPNDWKLVRYDPNYPPTAIGGILSVY
jgi:hypothetical protein